MKIELNGDEELFLELLARRYWHGMFQKIEIVKNEVVEERFRDALFSIVKKIEESAS